MTGAIFGEAGAGESIARGEVVYTAIGSDGMVAFGSDRCIKSSCAWSLHSQP